MVLHSSHFLPLKVQQRHTLNRRLFHFGHNSFALHLESFAAQDLSIQRFYSPSIAADIDTPSDLMAFILGLTDQIRWRPILYRVSAHRFLHARQSIVVIALLPNDCK